MECYLVGTLNLDVSPPVLMRVGVYSESAYTLTYCGGGEFFVDLAYDKGHTFEEARDRLLTTIKKTTYLRWVVPWLSTDDRDAYDRLPEHEKS